MEIKNRVGVILLTVDGDTLCGANLSGANLSGADLSSADLRFADLSGANLSGADLRFADLSSADLRWVNLRFADLSGADLREADLRFADLRSADLNGAVGVIAAGSPDRWHAHGWQHEGRLSIRIGCREKRLAEAREYWAGKPDRREVLAAVEYIAAVAAIRGWQV
jgi:hypothetical protein